MESEGHVKEAFAEGNLEKVVYALEQELDVTVAEIDALSEMIDIDLCNPQFLAYLSMTLGTRIGEIGLKIVGGI